MKKTIIFFSLILLIACKKDQEQPSSSVTGLKDIGMVQGYDTLDLPVELKELDDSVILSVVGLPVNVLTSFTKLDSTGKYNIRFTTHFTIFPEEDVVPEKMVDTGNYALKLIVSGKKEVKQYPFNLYIKPHNAMSIAGGYFQNSMCEPGWGSAVNHPVNVTFLGRGRNDWAVNIEGISYNSAPAFTDTFMLYLTDDTFHTQLAWSKLGFMIAFNGSYRDNRVNLTINPGTPSNTCTLKLTR